MKKVSKQLPRNILAEGYDLSNEICDSLSQFEQSSIIPALEKARLRVVRKSIDRGFGLQPDDPQWLYQLAGSGDSPELGKKLEDAFKSKDVGVFEKIVKILKQPKPTYDDCRYEIDNLDWWLLEGWCRPELSYHASFCYYVDSALATLMVHCFGAVDSLSSKSIRKRWERLGLIKHPVRLFKGIRISGEHFSPIPYKKYLA